MKVIFLDIDGVLNGHEFDREVMCGQIHPDKVARLNRILRATDAKVVLSSAWRYIVHRGEANLMGLEWLLRSHGVIADRLIDVTRPDTMVTRAVYTGVPSSWPATNERGQQIADWLAAHPGPIIGPATRYVVIDDLDLGISELHPLVLTDGTIGLTDANAEDAIRLLSEQKVKA